MKLGDRVKVMRGVEAYDEAVYWFRFGNGMLAVIKTASDGKLYPVVVSPLDLRPAKGNIEEDLPEWAL